MKPTIDPLLAALAETPRLLQELINEIPQDRLTKAFIPGKWSIHEHATHVAVGDQYGFQKRLADFKTLERPTFEPLSGESFPKDFFINLNLHETVEAFFEIRQTTLVMARRFQEKDWHKEAQHPEYNKYTPYIMLRHLLMHDHTHLYKIEDMGYGINFE